jgi:hypothetical protein
MIANMQQVAPVPTLLQSLVHGSPKLQSCSGGLPSSCHLREERGDFLSDMCALQGLLTLNYRRYPVCEASVHTQCSLPLSLEFLQRKKDILQQLQHIAIVAVCALLLKCTHHECLYTHTAALQKHVHTETRTHAHNHARLYQFTLQ